MATLVYRYGLRPPIEGAQFIAAQMDAAHRYRNVLVSIAHGERNARRSAIEAIPEVQAATEEARALLDALLRAGDAMKAEHVKARAKEHSENAQAVRTAAREAFKASMTRLYDARRAAGRDPVVRAEIKRVTDLSHELYVSARRWQSPWWGTYSFVEKRHEQSLQRVLSPGKKIELPLWDELDPCDPRFVSAANESNIIGAYNNQGPEADHSSWLAIEPGIVLGASKHPPSAKRQGLYRVLAMQIGTESRGGKKVWGRWPMILDRPIPDGARITECKIIMRTEGPHRRWEAHLTLNMDAAPRREECGEGRIAMDVGWRLLGDELRVARAVADDGQTYELRLSARLIESLTKANSLRSIRDVNFANARLALLYWCGSVTMPAWLAETILRPDDPAKRWQAIGKWKNPRRLASLVERWRHARFAGDAQAFALFEAWRLQELHLWDWECSQRAQALAQRKQFYREFAAKLARRYGVLVLEKFDLRRVVELPDLESTEHSFETARSMRTIAAISELRNVLEHAFTVRGGTVRTRDATLTTHECPLCAAVTDFDAARHVRWTCASCGAQWDQDDSACRILLSRDARELAHEQAGPTVQQKPKRESRWAKIKREKRERAEKAEAACKAEGKTSS
jgi:hypothetical protein